MTECERYRAALERLASMASVGDRAGILGDSWQADELRARVDLAREAIK